MTATAGVPQAVLSAAPGTAPGERLRQLHLSKVLVVGVVLVALLLLVLYPFGWVVYNSLHEDTTQAWSLSNYLNLFADKDLYLPMLNSVLLATAVGIVSVLLGVPAAWLVGRTDMPGRRTVRTLTLAAFVTPSFVGATAWILLGAPNSGWLNHAWRWVAGAEQPLFNIYSMAGTVFVSAIYTVPFTFTIVGSALDSMAVELEDAATTLGSGMQ
jgi:iron(III) transport system permease protein